MNRPDGTHGRSPNVVPSASPLPRLASRLLRYLVPATEAEAILGDLAEHHARRAAQRGELRARVWLARQVLVVPARLAVARGRSARPALAEARYALRALRQSPIFSTVAVLSLALGIGANTTIFGTARALLFRDLPVESAEDLRLLYRTSPPLIDVSNHSSSGATDPDTGESYVSTFSFAQFEELRELADERLSVAAYNLVRQVAVVIGDRPAVAAGGQLVSGEFFSTLRLPTSLGRPLGPRDDRPGAAPVVVISHGFWQRVLAADPEVVGSSLEINGTEFEVVGVTRRGYRGLSPGGFFPPTELTAPISAVEAFAPEFAPPGIDPFTSRNRYWVRILGRVTPGAEAEPGRQAMSTRLRQMMTADGQVAAEHLDALRVQVLPGARGLDSLRAPAERPLRILGVVVLAVLLIACANVATMMLARGEAQRTELAVRRALGATRGRLVRELCLQSAFLAAGGAAFGLLIARWSSPWIGAALTAGIGRVDVSFEIDAALVAATAAIASVVVLACGVLPALRATRSTDLRTREGSRPQVLGRTLIAAQIAISAPLIVGAGLFLQTIGNLGAIELGFDAGGLTTFRVDGRKVVADEIALGALYGRVREEVATVPGVTSVTLGELLPASGWHSNTWVTIGEERESMFMSGIGPGYFETLGVPVLRGRTLSGTEDHGDPRVVLVNEAAERLHWRGNALGQRFLVGSDEVEIVGVVPDLMYDHLRVGARPLFYDPFQQRSYIGDLFVILRTARPTARLESELREAVARVHAGLPLTELQTQDDVLAAATAQERILARVLTGFSAFALFIACLGLYGVTAYSVARRTAEIGVRLALGAAPRGILSLVLGQVLRLTSIGLVVGLLIAWLSGSSVESLLYGVEATDPTTLIGTALILMTVALLAGALPARRAARTDAVAALTRE